MSIQTGDNKFATAKWIVDPTLGKGTHTTITSALTSASSGDTIFVKPGTYTENLTLKAGVNISAYDCDSSTPNVTIIGKCSYTSAGIVTLSGLRLQTNSDYLLSVTGSSASVVKLIHCYMNAANNTGIHFTSSSSSAVIDLQYCDGDLGTSGIAMFTHSSAGTLEFIWTQWANSALGTTASTISSGILFVNWSNILSPITTSSTSTFGANWSNFFIGGNATALTIGGSGAQQIAHCTISSGTASAVSISSGATGELNNCRVLSSNTNAITGLGTLQYTDISFPSTSYKINTSTLTPKNLDVGGISFDGGINVLNFYQAGTWTPTISFGGASVGITYSIQQGNYVRIGNLVYISATVFVTNKGSSTGNAKMDGLPFTTANLTIGPDFGCNIDRVTFSTGYTSIYGTADEAATSIEIFQQGKSGSANTALTNANFTGGFALTIYGGYFIS